MAANQTVASQQARFGATAGLYTIVVIAILAAINYLGVRFNKPLDLTSNKRFTLSQETQRIIGNLKQDATITYFDNPRNFDQARGLLDRYRNLSPKIHVEYINPQTQPTRAENMASDLWARRLWTRIRGVKKRSRSMSKESPARS